jgi:hypothetical protein
MTNLQTFGKRLSGNATPGQEPARPWRGCGKLYLIFGKARLVIAVADCVLVRFNGAEALCRGAVQSCRN